MKRSGQPLTLRNVSIWLFFCVVLAAAVLESGGLDSWDTANRLQVTRWIWSDEPQVSKNPEQSWYGVIGRGGEKFAWTGLGQSLWMLPAHFVAANAVQLVVSNAETAHRVEEIIVVYLTFPLTSALAVVVMAHLFSALGYRPEVAGLGALSAFWCTSLLPYTNINQENSLILLCAATGYWSVLQGTKRDALWWWILAGMAAGFGMLIRLTTVFDSAILAVFGLVLISAQAGRGLPWIWRHYSPRILSAITAWAVFVFVERAYNFYRFDSWFANYRDIMHEQRPEIFPPGDFFNGLYLLTIAPGGGLWHFDPLLLVTGAAMVMLWSCFSREVRALSLSLSGLLIIYILFHAADPWPLGTSAWGSRYTTTPVVLLSAMAIPLVNTGAGAKSAILRRLAPWAVLAALVVQLLSSLFWYQLEEIQRLERLGASQSMVILRAQNAAALVTDRWEEWGLLPSTKSDRLRTPNYFPFLAAKHISPSVGQTAKVAWFVLLAVAVAVNLWLLSRLICSMRAGPQESGK